MIGSFIVAETFLVNNLIPYMKLTILKITSRIIVYFEASCNTAITKHICNVNSSKTIVNLLNKSLDIFFPPN